MNKLLIKSKKILKLAVALSLIVTLVVLFGAINHNYVNAANIANFNPGRVIDDSVFYDTSTMNANDIQDFLNRHIGWSTSSKSQTTAICDSNGSQIYSGSITRAQYSASKGYSTPFVCLNGYLTNSLNEPADAYCSGYTGSVQSAAQIIYAVGQSCGINPQVLIVLLQKEQGLITDTWPWSIQYQSATGYACPDSSGCNPAYAGFFNQVYNAARQFKIYQVLPKSFSYQVYSNNLIPYNPNSSCGSSSVYIQNQATAGLYNYTPYQPNSAALSAGYDNGDSCSSYGNRNFWEYFTDWFGSTNQVLKGCNISASNTMCVWRLITPSGQDFLTNNIDERNALVAGGYSYQNVAFYSHSSQTMNSIPVYRLISGAGIHYWCVDNNEIQSLISNGYRNEGIAWFADPAPANTDYPVFQLFNGSNSEWTTDSNTKNQLISQGYSLVGTPFSSPSPLVEVWAPNQNQSIVFRLFNNRTGQHFWTANVSERDSLIIGGAYSYEGGAMNSQESTTNSAPVYRLFNNRTGQHFCTASQAESNFLSSGGGYTYEGVAWNGF